MFGLEKNPQQTASYDLEKDLLGSNGQDKRKALKNIISERSSWIKKNLQEGQSKETFNELELLLKGYNALTTVIDRVK